MVEGARGEKGNQVRQHELAPVLELYCLPTFTNLKSRRSLRAIDEPSPTESAKDPLVSVRYRQGQMSNYKKGDARANLKDLQVPETRHSPRSGKSSSSKAGDKVETSWRPDQSGDDIRMAIRGTGCRLVWALDGTSVGRNMTVLSPPP